LGIVVDQSPSGSAPKGTTVQLSVSKGPKETAVPDVASQDEDSARSTLEGAGFTVTVSRETVTDPGLDGIVLNQSPTGGTKDEQRTTARMHVGTLVSVHAAQ